MSQIVWKAVYIFSKKIWFCLRSNFLS